MPRHDHGEQVDLAGHEQANARKDALTKKALWVVKSPDRHDGCGITEEANQPVNDHITIKTAQIYHGRFILIMLHGNCQYQMLQACQQADPSKNPAAKSPFWTDQASKRKQSEPTNSGA